MCRRHIHTHTYMPIQILSACMHARMHVCIVCKVCKYALPFSVNKWEDQSTMTQEIPLASGTFDVFGKLPGLFRE